MKHFWKHYILYFVMAISILFMLAIFADWVLVGHIKPVQEGFAVVAGACATVCVLRLRGQGW